MATRRKRSSAKPVSQTAKAGRPKARPARQPGQLKKHRRPAKTPRISVIRLERALRVFSDTKDVGEAARSIRVSKKRFLQAAKRYTAIRKQKSGWKLAARLKRAMPIFSNGRHVAITVHSKTASSIGEYNSAVAQFLATNNPAILAEFAGRSVKDVNGKKHPLETDPNTLYRLSSAGEPFESIYRIVL